MSEKLCTGCGAVKNISEFAKNKSRKDGLQSVCRACKKKRDAEWYKANKESQLARNRRNYKKYRKRLDEYKARKGCCRCGDSDPCCLDFHHHNEDKDHEVSRMLTQFGAKRVWAEVAKCVVICASCHRKLHAGRFSLDL